MKALKHLVAVMIILTLSMAACSDSADELSYPYQATELGTQVYTEDSVATIDWSNRDNTSADTATTSPVVKQSSTTPATPDNDEIVITISSDGINVDAPNYSSYSGGDVNKLVLERDYGGNVQSLIVNGVTMYYDPMIHNHTYKYLDANTLEVQKGNTLNHIVADHQKMGYHDLTMKEIYRCNQYLHKRGKKGTIYPGDILCLQCR